ncbi:MAG: hypothetical protein ABSB99_01285 [Acidimicrobiales bacterium]
MVTNLVALVVLPAPGLRSTGIGGMFMPLVSILVVNTLLLALLGGLGPRVDWPRLRKEQHASRSWSAWGRGVVRWRWAAAGLAIVLLGLFAVPVLQIEVGLTEVNALTKTGIAHAEYENLVRGGVPQGVLTPIEVLTTTQAAPQVRATLAGAPGITTAVAPSGSTGSRAGTSDIIAVPDSATVNNTTLAPVRAVEAAVEHSPGAIGVIGTGAIEQDYGRAVFGIPPPARSPSGSRSWSSRSSSACRWTTRCSSSPG